MIILTESSEKENLGMNKILIESCEDCKYLTVGYNGEYRCKKIPNPDNEYYGPDYFGDSPPKKIPNNCPRIKKRKGR